MISLPMGLSTATTASRPANWAWAAHRRAGTSSNKDMPTVIAPAPSRMLVVAIRPGRDEDPRIDSSIIGRVSLENRSTALDPRP